MRDWLNSILGQDGGRVAQFALALIAVVLLILLLAWIFRRLQPGSKLIAAAGGKGRKRLGVLEASDVDARRRLVLVRRDDVEHLIMIGGPNDLLIESRILRGGHATNRPNIQHMPRPAATDADRLNAPPTGAAPTGSSLPASFPTPQPTTAPSPEPIAAQIPASIAAPVAPQMRPAAVEEVEISLDEIDLEAPVTAAPPPIAVAPAPAKPQLAPPTFVPPANRPPMTPITPTPPTPMSPPVDTRRPSLGDLLSAATAAKSANPRDAQQPLTAPPPMPRMAPPTPQPQPMPPQHPDLEEDDREMPTQVVARRPLPPRIQPPQQIAEPATVVTVDEPVSRETEVTSQIERALADLNPGGAPVDTQPRAEPFPPLRRPQLEPVQTASPTIARPALIAPTPAPSMPAIPLRPTPPARPSLPDRPVMERPVMERPAPVERPALVERPPLVERPIPVERPPLPDRIETPSRPALEPETKTEDRAATGEISRPFVATPLPEPATAPRPITAPIPRPPSFATSEPVAPVPAPAPTPSAQQKTDELEEEMAKLLSELGGSSSR